MEIKIILIFGLMLLIPITIADLQDTYDKVYNSEHVPNIEKDGQVCVWDVYKEEYRCYDKREIVETENPMGLILSVWGIEGVLLLGIIYIKRKWKQKATLTQK